ncbi:ganglioside GM2 activator-like [Liolophura sinensis]|uniref:ganglioside GM2 activator-like n=1 Tax=Liolophura sinensis TaxID=3198878 RepID=UPI00315926A3
MTEYSHLFEYLTFPAQNKAVDPRVTRWAWSSCGGTTDLVVVGNITVAPDPIKLPGTITVSVAAKIKQDIPDPIEAQLTIRKKLGILWITIPCIDNVGSCTYPGVCQMLEKVTCPAPVVSIGQNCRCPIKQSDGFYMQPSEFVINAGGDIPTGDYQIEAKASHNGQSITCVNISFTIEH